MQELDQTHNEFVSESAPSECGEVQRQLESRLDRRLRIGEFEETFGAMNPPVATLFDPTEGNGGHGRE